MHFIFYLVVTWYMLRKEQDQPWKARHPGASWGSQTSQGDSRQFRDSFGCERALSPEVLVINDIVSESINTDVFKGLDLASFLLCALETRWQGFGADSCYLQKLGWGGSFLMVHRNNAGRLGCWLIYVCLETRWLGQNPWFLSARMTL